MSILRKPYEISLWRDEWDPDLNQYVEKRYITIGSSDMEFNGRAIDPKLVRKTNGEISFSFKMYYQFVDTITGEKVENPFTSHINNETKVKLKYGSEWFDLLVKNIVQDSNDKSYTYSLESQHITELSKNGFNITLDSSLMNNMGTIEELSSKVLQDTDWAVESEQIVQTQDEALVMLTVVANSGINAYLIDDANLVESGAVLKTQTTHIQKGEKIYAFCSSCSGAPYRFQFIYKANDDFEKYSNRVIADTHCQYVIDDPVYLPENNGFVIPEGFALDTNRENTSNLGNKSCISVLYRGRKYVYDSITEYHAGLDRYLERYEDSTGRQYYKYSTTHYITPNLIQNLVVNSDFESVSGWKGGLFCEADNTAKGANVDINTIRLIDNVIVTGAQDMYNGDWEPTNIYTPCLHCTNMANIGTEHKVITNSGPYSMRHQLEGFRAGETYIIEMSFYRTLERGTTYRVKDVPQEVAFRIANFAVKSDRNGYVLAQHSLVNTGGSTLDHDDNNHNDTVLFYAKETSTYDANKYEHTIVLDNVQIQQTLTQQDLINDNYKFFIEFLDSSTDDEYFITKLRIYKKFSKGANGYYTPDDAIFISDQGDIVEIGATYYTEDLFFPVVPDDKREYKEIIFEPADKIFKPKYSQSATKRSAVDVKESNYFNAIQSIAETFKVWPKINIEHAQDGTILNKSIKFQNYVGQPNYVGFKYGVNSKGVKRTLDSKQIVSKLIVKANTNEYAPNGFCTIAKANANYIKDNVIYDFGYYANKGLLDAITLQETLYLVQNPDEIDALSDGLQLRTALTPQTVSNYLWSCEGYYYKLRKINLELERLSNLINNSTIPLSKAIADFNTYDAMVFAAESNLVDAKQDFYEIANFPIEEISINDNAETVKKSETLLSYRTKIEEFASQLVVATTKRQEALATKSDLESALVVLEQQYDNGITLKKELNKLFYIRYARFIQEGTWTEDSYLDNNLYYNDAMSVSYESSMPKVSYQIDVISLAGLPGYENFDFQIGDQTFVEDIEFFGYDQEHNPYREQITITETTENLDDPSKNTIKVQNYENQFQDLFQTITATVQSVQYNEGAYQKAAALAQADAAHKIQYLNDAITDASMKLTNAGAQDWTLDENGLTLISRTTQDKLRAVGGAILLGQTDENGNEKWVTGITANGISANLISAGVINTGEIQIMNGKDPTFRWDAHGITAYDFDNRLSDTQLSGINKNKGIRFDRFGLYGYSNINGETWKPNNVQEIFEQSDFALTREGLFLKLGQGRYDLGINKNGDIVTIPVDKQWHSTITKIGKTGNYIYNAWDNSMPIYDANSTAPSFVKIFSVAPDLEGNEQLVIYDDGTLVANNVKFTGSATWVPEASPARSIYGPRELKDFPPPKHWYYSEVPDEDPGAAESNISKRWHKIKGPNDVYYCHTDTAGAVWDGPFLISGRSIEQTVTEYALAMPGQDPETITSWGDLPNQVAPGQCLFIRSYDMYDDGTASGYRYSVSYYGEDGAEGVFSYIESSMGVLFEVEQEGYTTLTAHITSAGQDKDPDGTKFVYTWYKNGAALGVSGKTIQLEIKSLLNATLYFEAELIENMR